MDEILFFLAAIVAIVAALGTALLRNPFYAVLSLVVHLLALSVLFLLLYAQFVAVVQVLVYVGAVMVLYVFVNAYVGGDKEPSGGSAPTLRAFSYAIGVTLAVTIGIAVLGTGLTAIDDKPAGIPAEYGSPGAIGELLLTRFLLPFEVASFLLLVAAIGAVVLARRRRGALPGEQQMYSALQVFTPKGIGSMRESVGGINPVPGARTVKRIAPNDPLPPEGERRSGADSEGSDR
ncbi:NADH-quinone oxidoreductase subunit J [Patulibacter sp. SYSU D01012]|uniref:NADH-quinone oxidoreductase subunit J family protein n=1 Tax=Patulibacter sp. SYSU D01012 TaxID=2817381 RepID=UPI001B30A6AD|nr:NADH-quinone oxidoreductase subunit J [Patulibacter sp. SYSU D01012]